MKKNIFLLYFVQASNYIFPLLTLPYLMRVLGAEHFGIMSMVQAWIQYTIIFVDYGFNFSATLLIAKNKENQHLLNKIYTVTTISKFLLFLIFLLIAVVYSLIFGLDICAKLFFCGMFAVLGTVFFPIWLFQGLEKMQGIVVSTTIAKCFSLIAVFLLVRDSNDIDLAIFSQSLGMFVSGIIAMWYIRKNKMVAFTKCRLPDVLASLKGGFDLFISNITISFYTTLNVIIIGYFAGPVYAGYFSAADKLRVAAQGLLTPVQQALFPRVSSLVSKGSNFKEILSLYGKKFILFGLFVSVSIAVVGYPVSLFYFSEEYRIASSLLLLMSPLPFIVSIGIVFGQWWLITNDHTAVVRNTYIRISMIHIIMAIALIHYAPVYGVTVSVLLTETIISCLFIRYCYRLATQNNNLA